MTSCRRATLPNASVEGPGMVLPVEEFEASYGKTDAAEKLWQAKDLRAALARFAMRASAFLVNAGLRARKVTAPAQPYVFGASFSAYARV